MVSNELILETLALQKERGLLKPFEDIFASGVIEFFKYQKRLSEKQSKKARMLALKVIQETDFDERGWFRL